jgi:hypothetical protein
MQLNITLVIIIALVCMFFGYFFGLFEGRGQGYKRRKKEDDEKKSENPAPVAPPPAPVVLDDPGLLRLKETGGQFQLEVDGVSVEVNSVAPEQRKRLIELITRVRPWVEGRPMTSTPGPPQVAPQPPQPVHAPTIQPSVSSYPPVQPVAPVISLAPFKKEEQPSAPTTMVGQIDAILQARIADTPMAKRGVKLEEAPGGGVNVVVGTSRYTGVGDVPDAEVQTVIRAAIAEWERKFTPGI